jgi:UDP-glucose 4-epimerase
LHSETTWLVTGGAGYIGSHVARDLLDFGYKVVVLDDLSTGREEFIDRRARFVKGSILDKSAIQQAISEAKHLSDDFAVMHIAGVKLPGESMVSPEKYWEVNAQGSIEIGLAALAGNAKALVFSSSCSIYGSVEDGPIDETGIPNPKSPYARSKLFAEMMFRDLSMAHGIPIASLRYFNVVGSRYEPIVDLSKANLFPAIINSINQETPFVIHGGDYVTRDGSCVRDYMHIGDLSNAHLLAANWILAQREIFEVFNFGTGTGTTVLEIISEFENQLSRKIDLAIGPRREGDPASITANAEKAMNVLGWRIQYGLEAMIESSLRFSISK